MLETVDSESLAIPPSSLVILRFSRYSYLK